MPEDIRTRVEEGKIPASAAYELSRVGDPERQSALAQRLAEGSLTRDSVSGAVKSERTEEAATTTEVKRLTVPLPEGRSVTVSGSGLTLDIVIETLQELLGKARKARTQGIELKPFVRSLKEAASN